MCPTCHHHMPVSHTILHFLCRVGTGTWTRNAHATSQQPTFGWPAKLQVIDRSKVCILTEGLWPLTLQGMGGPDGNFSWEDVVSSGARSRKAAEEAFYGLGDFFRDLDRDRVERRRSKGRPEQPMSLWEELSDIGEEFVEFLEKEIGLSAPRVS